MGHINFWLTLNGSHLLVADRMGHIGLLLTLIGSLKLLVDTEGVIAASG